MRAKHWRVLRWVVAGIGGATLLGTAWFWVLPRWAWWADKAPGQPLRPAAAVEQVHVGTVEVRRDLFSCGHQAVTSDRVPESSLGLGREAYGRRHPEYRVLEFSADRVVIEAHRPELCTDCRSGQFIGVRNGYVTVYAGRPERPGPVVEVTRIPVKALPDFERVRITRGIPVEGLSQRLQVLEGLSEYGER